MPKTKPRAAAHGGKKGNFADRRDGLLTLFSDQDEREDGKWQQSFGQRPEKPKQGKIFIAREARRS